LHRHRKSADSNLRRWLIKLVEVGVLETHKVDDGKLTSNGSNMYKLVVDLGPVAPIVRSGGQVFDPNSSAIIKPKNTGTPASAAVYGGANDAVIEKFNAKREEIGTKALAEALGITDSAVRMISTATIQSDTDI